MLTLPLNEECHAEKDIITDIIHERAIKCK